MALNNKLWEEAKKSAAYKRLLNDSGNHLYIPLSVLPKQLQDKVEKLRNIFKELIRRADQIKYN